MTRREAILAAGRLAGGAAAAGALAGCEPRGAPAAGGPTTLDVMCHPGQILPILTHQADHLQRERGISLRIIESPDYGSYLDVLKDLRAGGGRYDIVMYYPRFAGELASSYLLPLDDLIARRGAGSLFDNIVPAYRVLYTRWGGKTIAAPVDGDVAMLYWRKDAFEEPGNRARYLERYREPLEPPRTWQQLLHVAEFFTGWTWGPSGKPGYGFQTSTWDRTFIDQQWAPMMASAGGNWLTKDVRPAWTGEPGVRALVDLKSLLGYAPEGSISLSWSQTMETVFANDVAVVLWYMDLGRLGWSPSSWFARSGGPETMRRFGYAQWPGYEVGGVRRNFNSMFYGRVVGISRFSKQPEAAFQVIETLLDPARRRLSLDDDQSGSDMCLETDYDPSAFRTLTPAPEFLEVAREVIANGFPEMQLPGAGEYMDQLQAGLHAYITGSEKDPRAALAGAAERWEAITERYGRAKQAEVWAEVRARYREAGLKVAEA